MWRYPWFLGPAASRLNWFPRREVSLPGFCPLRHAHLVLQLAGALRISYADVRALLMTYADASGNGAPDYSPFPFDVECDLYSGYVRDLYPVDGDPLETYDFGSASTKNGLRPYASTAYVIKTADWFRYGLTPSAAVKDFTADSRGRFLSGERRATTLPGMPTEIALDACARQVNRWTTRGEESWIRARQPADG